MRAALFCSLSVLCRMQVCSVSVLFCFYFFRRRPSGIDCLSVNFLICTDMYIVCLLRFQFGNSLFLCLIGFDGLAFRGLLAEVLGRAVLDLITLNSRYRFPCRGELLLAGSQFFD